MPTDPVMLKVNKRKRVLLSLFLFSLITFLIFLIIVMPLQYLKIEDLNNVEVNAVFPVREGEVFTIKYTHSVELLPVYETYLIKERQIWLQETRFYSFGAGMGLLEGRGVYLEQNGMMKIRDLSEIIEPLILRTGELSKHQFIYRDQSYALTDIFGTEARLIFEVSRGFDWKLLKATDRFQCSFLF